MPNRKIPKIPEITQNQFAEIISLIEKLCTEHLNNEYYEALAESFGLSQGTISTKSKSIRNMFKMTQLDPRWILPSRMDNHPAIWMIRVNGYIIDARKAPYEIQEQAYNAGIIPYIPTDKVIA